MASEGTDGRAPALPLRVLIAHRPNRVVWVMEREVREGPLIFSCYFVTYMKNIATGSVDTMDKGEGVMLSRHNFIYCVVALPTIKSASLEQNPSEPYLCFWYIASKSLMKQTLISSLSNFSIALVTCFQGVFEYCKEKQPMRQTTIKKKVWISRQINSETYMQQTLHKRYL